jgi:hypothetical protein
MEIRFNIAKQLEGMESFNPIVRVTILKLPEVLGIGFHTMPPNIISCNYKDVLTGRVHVFDLTNLC